MTNNRPCYCDRIRLEKALAKRWRWAATARFFVFLAVLFSHC
jgi:hypothetical protein